MTASPDNVTVAYFTMEVGLASDVPTYSGGLGVLAGDTLRSAADLTLPMVAVTLAHRKGYFRQSLDASGMQKEAPDAWRPEERLQPTTAKCEVRIEGRSVFLRAWRYDVIGVTGAVVPVFLLDADLTENSAEDRKLTDHLYGGDDRYRLCQEVLLGVGGVRVLRDLGYHKLERFHMNEGHSALLALELLYERMRDGERVENAVAEVKRRCVFTTHTPVAAGHDEFSEPLVAAVLMPSQMEALRALGFHDGRLSMTQLALRLSRFVNGVTKRHAVVSRALFPGYPIHAITNGVHSATWTGPAFCALYDRLIPDWKEDNLSLRSALQIPADEIWEAHVAQKRRLVERVHAHAGVALDEKVFTIGSARRATAYKRPTLLLSQPDRLAQIAKRFGGLQVVYAGKAHPHDHEGKELIRQLATVEAEAGVPLRVAYLPGYDMDVGGVLTSGVDLWLNTPRPPLEASGTSGMKAAHNGVPSLSVLDGWWIEGHVDAVTGWAIGPGMNGVAIERSDAEDAEDLYRMLETRILPLFHEEPQRWRELMRFTIALNASFFNTQRMLGEYVLEAYRECLLSSPGLVGDVSAAAR
jgi:starch phosphorylase